jgi:16S rRNA (cytosine967-C5)-methyltransferase
VNARDVAREVLGRVEAHGAWATPALAAALGKAGPGLDPRDRRLAAELVYGVLRHQSRLDRALGSYADLRRTPRAVVIALRVAAYQLLLLDRIPAHAAVDDAVDAVRRTASTDPVTRGDAVRRTASTDPATRGSAARAAGGDKLAGFANAVLRRLAAAGEPPVPAGDRRLRLEIEHSMPRWIIDAVADAREEDAAATWGRAEERRDEPSALREAQARGPGVAPERRLMIDQLDAAVAALSATAAPPPLWLRTNLRRVARADLAAALAPLLAGGHAPAASPLVASALDATGLPDPEASPPIAAGDASVQDLAAQVVGYLAAPAPGQRVLDACAGHGGKATHLAELAGDAAAIDAADVSADKLKRLAASARRLGLSSIRTVPADAVRADAPLAPAYDLVVVDAPCTGLGVLRRHPEAKWRLRASDVPAAAARQRALLDACAARVAPGGALVYAVCSVALAEGPAQIDAFLARHPDFALARPPEGEGAGVEWAAMTDDRGRVRVWPHRHGGDGFFAVRLARR